MREVLIVDAAPTFREFLKEKLVDEKINVETVVGIRNAFPKMIKLLPDLIILDASSSLDEAIEFLQTKKADVNAAHTPVIVVGPMIERENVAALIQYGVVKYFKKPVQFDVFFDSIGKILHTAFSIDNTPCMLDVHVNDKILFIEVAQGLNREKVMLLKYKIAELLEENDLHDPKIIVMMSDLELSFVDGPNLELLLDNVIANSKISRQNVKILSLSQFAKELVAGHPRYAGIQVVDSLSQALPSVVKEYGNTNMPELVTDKILSSTNNSTEGTLETRFYSDTKSHTEKTAGAVAIAAIVDDQAIFRNILHSHLSSINAESELFESGEQFLKAIEEKQYDLIILDIFMPGLSGLDVLKTLQQKQSETPVIVYSQAIQKEAVMMALNLGAKSYLVKPQKPETILAKCVEVLKNRVKK